MVKTQHRCIDMSIINLTSMLGSSTQRCFVGPTELDKLKVPLGSWCIVQHDGYESICSLWLRNDLQDGWIEVQETVTVHSEEPRSQISKTRRITIESIKPIPKPPPSQGIKVSLITDFKNLRHLQQASREAVIRQLRHLLVGFAIRKGCMISFQSGSGFAGPKILQVAVDECFVEEKNQTGLGGVAVQRQNGGSLTQSAKDESGNSFVGGDGDLPLPLLSDNLNRTGNNSTSEASSDRRSTSPALDPSSSPTQDASSDFSKTKTIHAKEHSASLSSLSSKATSVDEVSSQRVSHDSTELPHVDSSSSYSSDGNSFVQLITEKTRIHIQNISSTESTQHYSNRRGVKVGGLEEAMSLLKKLIEYPAEYPESLGRLRLMQSHGILLRGPPGCGKTSLMQSVASQCKVCLLQINGAEIFGSSPGESETNLRQVFVKAKTIAETHRCILFIDELDVLCPKRDGDGGTHEGRVVAELLMLMDEVRGQSKVLVVGATSRPNALDPALRRTGRFDQEVLVGMPTTSQRASILECHCRGMHLADNVDLSELAKQCNGYNGADLASLCQQAIFRALGRISPDQADGGLSNSLECPAVTLEDFIGSLSHVTPSLHRAAGSILKELQPVGWDAIGGLIDVKSQLKQAVEWPMTHWQSFARLGVRGPSGVLLYGPPGCCKTTLAQAAATACKATFLSLSCAELYSPFVGNSEKIISEVFRKARLTTPAIVFLDELDSLIGGRGTEKGRGQSERLLSCLLVEMDGIGVPPGEDTPTEGGAGDGKAEMNTPRVLVVGASNRIDLIDGALLRPGRFDCLIYVPPPDKQGRLEILSVYTQRMPLDEGVCLEDLADATHMYTGADLEGLCREAGLLALEEHGLDNVDSCFVHQKHFISALDWCRPSLTDELVARYGKTESDAS
ncbi:uncharacterized protein [Asterias amurensis]|uniref:uncharacterized protein n=1 Tax=Asterias amurensis TaxID=7602 RepID=UPI003AB1C415